MYSCLICHQLCSSLNPCNAICKECKNGTTVQRKHVRSRHKGNTTVYVVRVRPHSSSVGDQQDHREGDI